MLVAGKQTQYRQALQFYIHPRQVITKFVSLCTLELFGCMFTNWSLELSA